MAEKTSLLQSIPPVEKADGRDDKVSLLSRADGRETESGGSAKQNVSLLERQSAPEGTGTEGSPSVESSAPDASEAVASEVVASGSEGEEVQTITSFQYVTYASFVLNFILAGFVAVALFKKLSKLTDARFSASAKAFAIGSLVVVFHGFFATYLYASHLNDPTRPLPLFTTLALWVVLGPFVGYVTRSLLARREKPNRKAALFDGAFYAVIFTLAAFGVSAAITTNGALLLTITACFLMIVPIARSLSAHKVACARHRELKETSSQILVYGLLFFPALLPVLAFAQVLGLPSLTTLFLVNFITIDFILVVALSFAVSADYFSTDESESAETSSTREKVEQRTAQAAPVQAPAQGKPKPKQPIVTGNPDDPIIQFLNSEGDDSEAGDSGQAAKPDKGAPRISPPRKPGHPGLSAPKKPGADGNKAPNKTPSKVKAPAKPKKRL